jgi:hypothetical protein
LCKLQKFNVITKKGSYLLPFKDDVLNIVVSHDAYSFLDGYFVYHLIFIPSKDKYKIICDKLGGIDMGSYAF